MMPGLDGFQVTERLRQRPETAAVPILLVTAHADDAELEHGLALGANDCLHKPFGAEELAARVRALCPPV
jgi:DNA-binding response OmpR family regulator